jgi:hypothetical protein
MLLSIELCASAIATLIATKAGEKAGEELQTTIEKLAQTIAEKYTKDPNAQSIVLLKVRQELKARQKSLEELDDLDDLPEQDYRSIEADISTWHTRFIALLEDILPQEFQEEWLGDVQERHNYSINEAIKNGDPKSKVYRETLLRGLGLIWSYLWLKADKFVSRWMTRAK